MGAMKRNTLSVLFIIKKAKLLKMVKLLFVCVSP